MFTSSLLGKDNKQFSFVKLYFEHKFCAFKENISVHEQYEMFYHINTQMTNISLIKKLNTLLKPDSQVTCLVCTAKMVAFGFILSEEKGSQAIRGSSYYSFQMVLFWVEGIIKKNTHFWQQRKGFSFQTPHTHFNFVGSSLPAVNRILN